MALSQFGYRDLCAAVGRSVLLWAHAEQTLDMCVTIVFKHCGGDAITSDLPRSLSTKTDYMRKAFKRLPQLEKLAKEGIDTMQRLDALALRRHDMVHGALASEMPSNGVWHFAKFDYGKDIHAVRDVFFTTDDFRDVERKTLGSGRGFIDSCE